MKPKQPKQGPKPAKPEWKYKLGIVYLTDTTTTASRVNRPSGEMRNPMIYYRMATLKRCYDFVDGRRELIGYAAIYPKEGGNAVAIYTAEKLWNNNVFSLTPKY
jgi:hypothetical protein